MACLACSWRIDLIASAEEWNCTSTEGNFTRTNDCMSTEIEVSGDLTIVGANGESSGALTTLYAADSYSRHFTLDGQFTLHIKWLRLTGGNVSKDTTVVKDKEGGAFFMHSGGGHFKAEFCSIINNIAVSGGGISARPNAGLALSQVTLYHTNVTGNTATHFGGGMRLNAHSDITKTQLKVTITGGVIKDNVAIAGKGGGGGMLVHNRVTINITGTQFIGNNATNCNGGGMMIKAGSTVRLNDVFFFDNRAELKGGGVYFENSNADYATLDMTGVVLERNIVMEAGANVNWGGGGLYLLYRVRAVLRECSFIKNEFPNHERGHQIHMRYNAHSNSSIASVNLTMVNTKFTDVVGGDPFYAIRHNDAGKTNGLEGFLLNDCSENPCTVSPYVGACKSADNPLHGVVCSIEWDCTKTNGEFSRLSNCTLGGDIVVDGDLSITGNPTSHTTLTAFTHANDATKNRRHFTLLAEHTLTLKWIRLIGSDIRVAEATAKHSGAIRLHYGVFIGTNLIVENNWASYGGCIGAEFNASVTLRSSTFRNNKATSNAGCIGITGGSTLNFHDGTVESNEANVASGSSSKGYGGGFFFCGPDNRGNITNSKIIGNKAKSQKGTDWSKGGGLYAGECESGSATALQATIHIDGTTISGNTAGFGGGGIQLHNHAKLYLNNVVLKNNTVAYGNKLGLGGGVFLRR